MHYALIDDLFDYEAFVRRVEEKIRESNDLLDEHTAAMLTVQELGRGHLGIADLHQGSSLVCFFGKVLDISELKEFTRDDGSSGMVARILVGDATGEIEVVFWDERAQAIQEIELGDVLEIVGRPKMNRSLEIHAQAVRSTPCDIPTRDHAGAGRSAAPQQETLTVRLLMMGDVRQFARRDGSIGEMVECMVGDGKGAARLVCWAPVILEGVKTGRTYVIQGARTTRGSAREYSLGEGATLSPADHEVGVPFASVESVIEGCTYSVRGKITEIEKPREFVTRKGDISWVQNLEVEDGTGHICVVIWGDQARTPLLAGEDVEIYNGTARTGRDGRIELHVGWGSGIRILEAAHEAVTIEGTVIPSRFGRCVDNGEECYLLDGNVPLGFEVRVKGTLKGMRLSLSDCEMVSIDREALRERIDHILNE